MPNKEISHTWILHGRPLCRIYYASVYVKFPVSKNN